MVVAKDRLFISLSYLGVFTYDISNPQLPVQTANLPGTYPTASPYMTWSDPYLILGGLMIYDLSDIDNPVLAAYSTIQDAWTGFVQDGIFYNATNQEGIYTFKLK